MPSNFAGTWQYVKLTLTGPTNLVKDLTTITIEDLNNQPSKFKFTAPDNASLDLVLDTKATDNIVSVKKMEGTKQTYRGRLVILSTNTPAFMIGVIASGTYPPADENEHRDDDRCDPVGDDNVEVFVAVKTS